MGVDARILIKITNPASWMDAATLRRTSSRLTSVIGPDHFFVEPEENRHALSFVIDDNARYPDEFEEFHDRPFDPAGPAMFSQDSSEEPYLIALENEQFIACHLFSRYYDEDYARGDWKTLFFVLMWLVYNIKDSEVWYGGDSSGCLMEQMTAERMNELSKFYLTSGNDSYWMNKKIANQCEFCAIGVVHSGGGAGVEFYGCDGCGQQWVVVREDRHSLGKITRWGDEAGENKYNMDSRTSFTMSDGIRTGKRTLYPFDGTFRSKYPYVYKSTDIPSLPPATKQIST